jgi:hypothetical protein
MQLLNSEPLFRESFQRVGCINFCQKMQRGNPEVAKEFALNFNGTKTKVGMLEFDVSKHSISVATEIPNYGEKWFKSMSLNSSFSKEFLKPEYQRTTCPREYLEVTCLNALTRCSGLSRDTSHVRGGSTWCTNTTSGYYYTSQEKKP